MVIYTILGVFDSIPQAQSMLLEAENVGFSLERISLMMHYPETLAKKQAFDTSLDVLLNLYQVTIPETGTVLIGGPFTATFGLTGATRATITDAASGLVASGIAGALYGLGLSQKHSLEIEENLQKGKILLALPVTEEQIPYAKELFSENYVLSSMIIKTPTHQYPYLLSSLISAYEPEAHQAFPMYVGVKGGKRSKSPTTKKRQRT